MLFKDYKANSILILFDNKEMNEDSLNKILLLDLKCLFNYKDKRR